jgi:dienelactone hydrolase
VRTALALVAATLFAASGAAADRNPTPGSALVLQLPGMHRAVVRHAHGLDVYRAPGAHGRLPAVLVGAPRSSGRAVGWAQAIAASGMSAVVFPGGLRPAIAAVRSNARKLGIDASRLCALGFSSGAAAQLSALGLRCNAVYYAALDPDRARARMTPLLLVKAGRDAATGASIDRFSAAAQAVHADARVVTNPVGARGFDTGPRTRPAQAAVRETLRFLRARLAQPVQLNASCASRAERRSALRFFAADDTPLAGVVLGKGPRAVVLVHEIDGSLCDWVPYARTLVARGLRVLAYNSRRPGVRVDLDVAAAVEAMRRTGSEHVVVTGASLGATGVLIGSASLAEQPAAVVSLSAPASFGPLRALPAVGRLHSPVFFAASADDEPFASDARSLYAASASADRQLEVLPGLAHGIQLLDDAALRARVTAFITAH